MKRTMVLPTILTVLTIILAACGPIGTSTPGTTGSPEAVPNPASEFCRANGGQLEIRTGADGGQTGVCVFANLSECEEWAYFRGECQPAAAPASAAASPSAATTDIQPITLQVLLPEDGSQSDLQQCQVVGTTSPGAVVTVNDEILLAAADGTFQTTVMLEEGPNLIEVVASNPSGAEAFANVTVTYQP